MRDYRVLVIGPRRALIETLRTRNIPFAVWRERATFPVTDACQTLTAPLWHTRAKLRQQISTSFGAYGYTHVIAGTEAGVYPAAVARRVLGARRQPATTALRCHDKLAMKRYLAAHDIPMTAFIAESALHSAQEAFALLGAPLVRKHRRSSGGRGLELLHRPTELVQRRDGRTLLERHITAPEASVESFVNRGRIHFVNTTRYLEKGHVNFVPAGFDADLLETLHAFNRRVIAALKIDWGMTHLEVYLTPKGPLFGEIAVRPPGGYIMNALRHAWGFDPWAALVAMELDEPFDFPAAAATWAGVDILHPGSGQVADVRGATAIRTHPALREFRLKLRPGDTVDRREGAGQDTGYLLYTAASPTSRLELFGYFREHFAIRMR
ncbi:MAG: hypothetical protein R3F42_06950 [Pseudomonadota bacterium]